MKYGVAKQTPASRNNWIWRRGALWAILAMLLCSCKSTSALPPVPLAEQVDLSRFMGDWYVIASIPTVLERDAWAAVESYRRNEDGSVATTFTYFKGGFDGPKRVMTSTGFVTTDPSNAVWGMQFMWPIKAEYLISWVNADYTQTVIARSKRDYVWVMARTPSISEENYRALVRWVGEMGYDISLLRRVPQKEPEKAAE